MVYVFVCYLEEFFQIKRLFFNLGNYVIKLSKLFKLLCYT